MYPMLLGHTLDITLTIDLSEKNYKEFLQKVQIRIIWMVPDIKIKINRMNNKAYLYMVF